MVEGWAEKDGERVGNVTFILRDAAARSAELRAERKSQPAGGQGAGH